VNNVNRDVDLDFKGMRDAFRAIDTTNSGIITIEQINRGFVYDNEETYLDNDKIKQIFSRFGPN